MLLIINGLSMAQQTENFCNDIDDKKVLKNYNKALTMLSQQREDEALGLLADIVSREPDFTESWAAMSEIYYHRYQKALNPKSKGSLLQNYAKCLIQIVETCPTYNNYSAQFVLGEIFFRQEDYKRASTYLTAFVEHVGPSHKNYEHAVGLLKYIADYNSLVDNPVPFSPVIVEGVSTVNDDYLPIISPDGTMAFYTRAHFKKDLSSIYGDKLVEEFTVARSIDGSGVRFSDGEPLPYPFNTGKNQGASAITIDNSTLYITICEFVSRDYDNCDIYYSHRTSTGWSELKNMGSEINGFNTWESQPTISADGKTLYFASIREGNVGFDPDYPTSDIWYSTQNSDGTWSKARNVGEVINTPGNEKSPFIHSDSQTLYFSSDGHQGVGGYDIFYSRFRENRWCKPVNIGYPINTPNNDLGFVVNTQGTKAYFASNKLDGKGGWDIYSFDLYEAARPEKVFLIKGQLIDDSGNVLTEAKLEVTNTRTEEVNEGIVNPETGRYAVAVTVPEVSTSTDKPAYDDYLMVVKKEDYSFTSALIEPDDTTFEQPLDVDFEVKPIEVGKSVEIKDIYYATASYQIDKKSLSVLNGFIDFLNENPKVKVEIRGHTDNVGSVQVNTRLSNQRAKAVYDYLLSKSVDKSRLSYKGYGPDKPVATNDTEAGRAKNRRTEFYIVEK